MKNVGGVGGETRETSDFLYLQFTFMVSIV